MNDCHLNVSPVTILILILMDLLHMLARCPAFFDIRASTVQTLKDIVVRKTNLQTWSSYFKDWSIILKNSSMC